MNTSTNTLEMSTAKTMSETCPHCGEEEEAVNMDQTGNPRWVELGLPPRVCGGCYDGTKERICETCEGCFLPRSDGTYIVCGECYDEEEEEDEETCEHCGGHEEDNALFQGNNGEFTGKWICRPCCWKDGELDDEEEAAKQKTLVDHARELVEKALTPSK